MDSQRFRESLIVYIVRVALSEPYEKVIKDETIFLNVAPNVGSRVLFLHVFKSWGIEKKVA